MVKLPDVDIDVYDREKTIALFDCVIASVLNEDELRKHPTGIFFQRIPVDPEKKLAIFPSGEKSGDLSTKMGFQKIDLISNSAYEHVRNQDHLIEIINRPFDWNLLKDKKIVSSLHHIKNHFDVIETYEPKSIEDLACLIAIIRPGKAHLIGEDWETIRKQIWQPNNDGYTFKKSHAIAFAMLIVVQLEAALEFARVDNQA